MAESGQALDWSSNVEHDSEFTLLEPGEYSFTAVAVEKSYYNGSANLAPCPMAIVHCKVSGDGGSTTIKHRLYLNTKTEGLLCQFFTAIGQRAHGQNYTMDWDKVAGSTGRCKLGQHEWTGKDGKTMTSNQIDSFLEPQQAVEANQTAPKRF